MIGYSHDCNEPFSPSLIKATGAVFLLAGLWIALALHKYLELDGDVSSGLPLFFCGLGIFVLVIASAACQCAVKGAAPKLYVVSEENRPEFGVRKLVSLVLSLRRYHWTEQDSGFPSHKVHNQRSSDDIKVGLWLTVAVSKFSG